MKTPPTPTIVLSLLFVLASVATAEAWYRRSWMYAIADNTTVAQLALPGTHDSAADQALQGQCQDWSIRTQLDNGIRFLDIRLFTNRTPGERWWTAHGPFELHPFERDVLKPTIDFLKARPSEVVFMSVKEERPNEFDDTEFKDHVFNGTNTYQGKAFKDWFYHLSSTSGRVTGSTTIGSLRGKIVLYDRAEFRNLSMGGIMEPPSSTYTQDEADMGKWFWYGYATDYDGKWTHISGYLSGATYGSFARTQLHVNYASGHFLGFDQNFIADFMNPRIKDWIYDNGSAGVGSFIIMDYPQQATVDRIIQNSINRYSTGNYSSNAHQTHSCALEGTTHTY